MSASEVRAAVEAAFRDFATTGVPSSGKHEPVKSEIRYALGALLEATLSSIGSGIERFATVALMNADTSRADGTLAYVYDNNGSPADPANGIYQWDDGGNAWVEADWYVAAVAAVVQPLVDEAEGFRDEAEGFRDDALAAFNGVVVRGGGALIDGVQPLATIGANDANGDFWSFIALMPDGTIKSTAIANSVVAQFNGFEFANVEVVGYSVAFLQRDADGNAYVLFGLRDDGTLYAWNGVEAGERVTVYHIPFHGQSNAMADQSTPIISDAPTGWGNLRFARGVATWSSVDNPQSPADRAGAGFALVDLTAQGVETRANALADAFKARLVDSSRYAPGDTVAGPKVLMSSASLGGRKLAELGPEDHGASGEPGARAPGGFWPTLKNDIVRAQAAVEALGWTYALPFWNYDQGESEGDGKLYINAVGTLPPSGIISGYADKALTMVEDFDTYARATLGKNYPTPCLITPACYNLYTPTAWLNVADETELAIVVGPRYQMPSALMSDPRGNNIHYSPDGHRWIGEMVAKVGNRVIREGEAWQPLRPLFATKVSATQVDVTLHVPRPPLVIDERTWPRIFGWGFKIFNGTVDAPTNTSYATAIEIRPDGRTVRLTFPSVPAGAMLSLGETGQYPQLVNLPVAAVGAATVNGAPGYTLAFAGDYLTLLERALRDGATYAYGNNPSQGVIRDVTFAAGTTTVYGELSELRGGGGYGPFEAGDLVSFGAIFARTNIRDEDNAASVGTFVSGDRAGQPYPLQNWLVQYLGFPIEGA